MSVTEDNKREYVDCMVHWRLSRGVAAQAESMLKGLKVGHSRGYIRGGGGHVTGRGGYSGRGGM